MENYTKKFISIVKEKMIFETFRQIIPKLSDSDKSFLLGLGEGMAMNIKQNTVKPEDTVYQYKLDI